MKKQILVGFILIGLLYLSYQYYVDYNKKKIYKTELINNLANRYRDIELNESKASTETIKKLSNIVPPVFLHTQNDSIAIYAKLLNSFSKNLSNNTHYPNLYENNELWESAKLSGILTEFDKSELDAMIKAYANEKKLNQIKKEIQMLTYSNFYDLEETIPDPNEVQNAYAKYHDLLLKEQNILVDFSLACKAAITLLDKENAIVKEIDSLKNK